MSEDALEAKIAKLRQEVEKLSAQHAEELALNASSPDGKWRELATKRAQVLARRKRQLDEMLDALQRGKAQRSSTNTNSKAKISAR